MTTSTPGKPWRDATFAATRKATLAKPRGRYGTTKLPSGARHDGRHAGADRHERLRVRGGHHITSLTRLRAG